MSRDTGGHAFPTSSTTGDRGDYTTEYSDGMTLRDYFAAKAPPPPMWWMESYASGASGLVTVADVMAQWAGCYAEAMLKERAK